MNRWHKSLAVALLVILLAALGTSPIAAAAPKVNISVQTNFGSFKLSIAADTPENKLAAVVSEQVWGQLGTVLTQRYGFQPGPGPFRHPGPPAGTDHQNYFTALRRCFPPARAQTCAGAGTQASTRS